MTGNAGLALSVEMVCQHFILKALQEVLSYLVLVEV